MKKYLLFDLDGTLTDSGEGIINCAALALEHFGLPVPSREELQVFVGPPLYESFQRFGVPADRMDEAIRVYRSRYIPTGMFENTRICGASTDTSRSTKDAVIAYLLAQSGAKEDMVMVGDTKYDVLGAKAHGIPAIGVSWGYGSVAEMLEAGAVGIAHSMDALLDILHKI